MNTKFSNNGVRIAIVISSLLLIGAVLFPMWRIELSAPQYPEGLLLQIWASKLTGNIDTVNGLNHYIGMRTLHEDDFVEFKILPGLLLFFSFSGVLVGFMNRKKLLYIWMVLFMVFAAVSMADFYYWEYEYGHDLDPSAPIQVPGMAYQPPFLGYKQMLNFGAFSIPDTGGWLFIGCGVLMFIITAMQWKAGRREKFIKQVSKAALFFLLITSVSCSNEVKPINYGKDDCQFCKMTIMDKKFGVEIITKKGRAFKLDDLVCAQKFVKDKGIEITDIKEVYVNNYEEPGELLNLSNAILVKKDELGSPMGGNIAAFANEAAADNFIEKGSGEVISNKIFGVFN